ncbi:MAG: nicotinate-nucleotide adenylyltransferase [Lachnospiraceae bacterium]|nr:nicotinate-nucleotide adenylyltransferase [Lachnospiraceae bacterium]
MDKIMRKIGILGGTFNPIHNGHIGLSLEAYESLELDEVLLIPSGLSYLKDPAEIAKAEDRKKMAELASHEYPHITVSDLELKRKGPSYTWETIKELRNTYGKCKFCKFYFIIGADILYGIESWKKPEYIFKHTAIAVKVRDNKHYAEIEDKALYLKAKYEAEICVLPAQRTDVSSRLIREKIRANESIKGLVPENVAIYIANNNLYEVK